MVFSTDLLTTPDKFGKSRLYQDLVYYSERYQRSIVVPKGFVTDYASIPRLFQLFLSKLGRHREAAVVHDYLYSADTEYKNITRKEADVIFSDAMQDKQVPGWKRATMYRAVRLFGGGAFRK